MKPIDKLREIASRLDDAAANVSEHGFSPIAIKASLLCDEIEAEIERDYMRLPVDADGVPIHVGDVMVDSKTSRTVVAVAPKSFMMAGYENGSFYRPGLAKNHHHVKPRTLEDVLIEYRLKAYNLYADQELTGDERVDEFKNLDAEYDSEIRELLGGDLE